MSQLGQIISSVPGFVKSLAGDAGTATPTILGVITLAGGTNIGTVAAGSTVTINLDGTTNHAIQVGNAGGSLTSLAVGGTGVILTGVVGADPTWTTTTYPATTAIGDILVATAANTITAVTGAATAGWLLTANGALTSPTFQAPPAGVVYASDPETIAGVVTNKAVAPSNLKAKLGLQTVHALPIGNSDSLALGWLAVGGTGVILTGVAGADPAWTTATYPSTATKGDVLVASANNVIGVVAGATTAGHVLMANGALTSPTFQALPAGTGVAFTCDGGTTSSGLAQNLLGTANQITTTGNGTTTMTLSIPSSPSLAGTLTVATGLTATSGDLTLTDGDAIITNKDVATTSPLVYFKKYRAAAALTSGDLTGTVKFGGYDGTQVTDSARITSTSSGTIASTRVAGDLKFYTHPDSAAADPTLRLTIGAAGNITVAAPDAGTALTITAGGITVTSGNIAASSGTVSASTTVTAGTNLVSTAGNLLLPNTTSTTGQIQFNAVRMFHNYGVATADQQNLFIGSSSGNFTLTTANSKYNVGLGAATLSALTTGGFNVAIGSQCGLRITQGSENIGIGVSSITYVTTGNYNTAVQGLGGVNYNGSWCTALGRGSGSLYVGTESNNICIVNPGVAGESNKIRIGTDGSGAGQQNATYIAGIFGVTPAATLNVALINSSHQLGSVASLGVAQGGTGIGTLTDHGILLGSGTGAITPLGSATDGQIPIGSTGADPVLATITAGTGMAVTNGAGTISIATSAGGMAVVNCTTSNAVAMAVNTRYIATSTNGTTLVVFTLPVAATIGDVLEVVGISTAYWEIDQNAANTIFYDNGGTTPGATGKVTVNGAHQYASVKLVAITTANWVITNVVGAITLA